MINYLKVSFGYFRMPAFSLNSNFLQSNGQPVILVRLSMPNNEQTYWLLYSLFRLVHFHSQYSWGLTYLSCLNLLTSNLKPFAIIDSQILSFQKRAVFNSCQLFVDWKLNLDLQLGHLSFRKLIEPSLRQTLHNQRDQST